MKGLAGSLILFVGILAGSVGPAAQQAGRGQGASAQTAQAAAPIDLTGYWVSIVTEDWRWRMIMPTVGDHSSVPLNVEGRRVTDGWDPAVDVAAHNECKAYGAPGIMRIPGRLHITWQDPSTLKIDTDAGQQTRLFRFGGSAPAAAAPSWQGQSAAVWEFSSGGRGATPGGSLTVETTSLRAGYLRRNGVPYSENTVLTEYFDRHNEVNGDVWLTVVTVVHDPKYLYQDFITSTQFKKEPDGSKWHATPCSIEPQ
jgi:hypothetical protein